MGAPAPPPQRAESQKTSGNPGRVPPAEDLTMIDNLEDHSPTTACQQHPRDWFDPTRRTFTRQQCLQCPIRRECGQAALRDRPTYGMWAGVWISNDFETKQHLFLAPTPRAVSAKTTPPQPITRAATTTSAPSRRSRPAKVGTLLIAAPPAAIAAQITARASGHCEIMAETCTHQQSAIFSRRRHTTAASALASPADAIAACPNCIDLIEHTDLPTALDLGYLVDPRSCTSTAAMLWRQHRWVYLDTRGRIHDADAPSQTHTAC
ncbi:hypothetical protein MKSMC1_60600 [Mycobacterium kansasii]|nr:hypothetical protein MKSMC1_60600 [Mycobacterium kansasii]